MKIAIVNTWRGGAVYNVSKPVADALRKGGVEVDYLTMRDDIEENEEFDRRFGEYDLVHFTYFPNAAPFMHSIEPPFTVGLHHIPPKNLTKYVEALNEIQPEGIMLPEPFPARQLANEGIGNWDIIPYAFDHSLYPRLPLPEKFTVGYLGCDYELKRFNTIKEAARVAGVKCVGIGRATLNEEEKYLPQEDITKLYEQISCYVVASYNDGGPLPPQEALCCGRPVVATPVGMMPSVIKEGVNGYFTNGTVSDIAEKIELAKGIETVNCNGDALPQVEAVAARWLRFFERYA